MIVPIDPYNTLYRPKLFTKTEKPTDDSKHRKVVVMVPGDASFHFLSTDGAYLKMNPIA